MPFGERVDVMAPVGVKNGWRVATCRSTKILGLWCTMVGFVAPAHPPHGPCCREGPARCL